MVWDIQSSCDDREHVLSAHLLRELESRYTVSSSQRDVLRDVARGVAVYCADDAMQGIPSTDLHVLLSRALWGVGETEVAEQVLNDHLEQRAIKDTLKVLLAVSDVSPMLWRAVVRGAIRRRTEWISADRVPLWVLDVARIRMEPCDMELARFLTVRILLRALAPVWNATAGRGALALRYGATSAEANDALAYCRAVLEREAADRGWQACPQVLRLR